MGRYVDCVKMGGHEIESIQKLSVFGSVARLIKLIVALSCAADVGEVCVLRRNAIRRLILLHF